MHKIQNHTSLACMKRKAGLAATQSSTSQDAWELQSNARIKGQAMQVDVCMLRQLQPISTEGRGGAAKMGWNHITLDPELDCVCCLRSGSL